MSAFAEFFLVAAVIYLWESFLWLPLRSVVLRRKWFSRNWQAVRPGHWFATRKAGLVAMIPILPDGGLALCQAPPLHAADADHVAIEIPGSEPVIHRLTDWTDLRVEHHSLIIGRNKIRISSPRALENLWRAKHRGSTPADAIQHLWQTSLCPSRAAHEWRRWKLVSAPIFPASLLLTTGFFVILPWVYLRAGIIPALAVLVGLWLLMILTACRLWWIGGRVYPEIKSTFRTDALLSLLVPFHAMRAMEIASVHAMATSHPSALVIGTGDLDNPWLGGFIREILHPRPDVSADIQQSAILRPLLTKALTRSGKSLEAYETVPLREDDPEAVSYCPRCHSIFGKNATACSDCQELPLKAFP